MVAVQVYDIESLTKAATAVPNVDGSVYKDHRLHDFEWDIVRESVYILAYAAQAVDFLQGTSYPTASLVLPLVGRLAQMAHANNTLKYAGKAVLVLNEQVAHARQLLYKEIEKRYFNGLMDCKLEDFAVATLLDPRYKSFKFKNTQRWMRGNLTRDQAVSFLRKAFDADWKPATIESTDSGKKRKCNDGTSKKVTVASFLMADSDSEDGGGGEPVAGTDDLLVVDELAEYLATVDARPEIALLDWWRERQSRFPNVARMARQFLAVPAKGTIQHALIAAGNT
ncbi:hypothetical protein CYMTET_23857 [Cymbomonas tetramitiformis]|uniref:HAT C-terminal dimerisation domain-containing protein n=1 Tax=Cymbomonas tetramitiformis TaxID=36881 RepID=A0AAE0L0I3_9CHLO|nr:hypothetical protein CYMTET_23857 [Cymbomonas tetramitiformis]